MNEGRLSTIKETIDNWYRNNIITSDEKIEDTPYCNDLTIGIYGGLKKDNKVGDLYYKKREDLYSEAAPSLTCQNKDYAYTVSDQVNGNGALTYKVGLLSADEIKYTDGTLNSNTTYYLYTGTDWWTASPFGFDGATTLGFRIGTDGHFSRYNVGNASGVRPAISLVPGIRSVDGTGTTDEPFIVK